MADKLVEKIAKEYYNFTVEQSWKLAGYERDIFLKSFIFARELEQAILSDPNIVVIDPDAELPKNRWPVGVYVTHPHFEPTHDAVSEAQQDMLKAGWVKKK